MKVAQFEQALPEPRLVAGIIRFDDGHQERPVQSLQQPRVRYILLPSNVHDTSRGLSVDGCRHPVDAEQTPMKEDLGVESTNRHIYGIEGAPSRDAPGEFCGDEEIGIFLCWSADVHGQLNKRVQKGYTYIASGEDGLKDFFSSIGSSP